MNTDYLVEFEQMNVTTKDVFDSGETGCLIILKDGTNLTSWSDVEYYCDQVLYISEDFSRQENQSRLLSECRNVKVIIMKNFKKSSKSLIFSDFEFLKAFYAINWELPKNSENMFNSFFSLEYVCFENCDTSNVENFWGTFCNCCNLKTLEGLENWDLSSAKNMESMFESCFLLKDISFLSNWDMTNVENIFEMFRDCYSISDASCLDWNFKNLEQGDNLFYNCKHLKKYPKWYDEDFVNQFGIRNELKKMDENTIYRKIKNEEFNPQDSFIAVSYIKDESLLTSLFKNNVLHFYVRRAVLLNPNFKDAEILDEYSHNFDPIYRAYSIENPNFKNIATLRDKAKNDINEIVRFKAEYKLNEVMEELRIKNYPQKFKDAYEKRAFRNLIEICIEWSEYNTEDANLNLAFVIVDSLSPQFDIEDTFEFYLHAAQYKPENRELYDWFNSTAINLMEKRANGNIGPFEMFNNPYKSERNSNEYVEKFHNIFYSILFDSQVKELEKLHELVDEWEEKYPEDANLHCVQVILNVNEKSKDQIEDSLNKARDLMPLDKNAYPLLLAIANMIYNVKFSDER